MLVWLLCRNKVDYLTNFSDIVLNQKACMWALFLLSTSCLQFKCEIFRWLLIAWHTCCKLLKKPIHLLTLLYIKIYASQKYKIVFPSNSKMYILPHPSKQDWTEIKSYTENICWFCFFFVVGKYSAGYFFSNVSFQMLKIVSLGELTAEITNAQ